MPTCPKCNDTGTWPILPIRYCTCEIGKRLEHAAETTKQQDARDKLWQATRVPSRFRNYTLDGHPDQDAALKVKAWQWGNQTGNLLITGPVGTGKTGLAVGLIRFRIDHGQPSRFITAPQMFDDMRPDSPHDPMRELQNAPFLILDDLGAEKPSEWVRERLYVLVNHRYEWELPTVITTNAGITSLADTLQDRIVSRLVQGVTVITMTGEDRRLA